MTATTTREDQVRIAYIARGGHDGTRVPLADIRNDLATAGLEDTEIDATLAGMYRRQEVNLTPAHNPRDLTAAQRAAGLRTGGEDKHWISIR